MTVARMVTALPGPLRASHVHYGRLRGFAAGATTADRLAGFDGGSGWEIGHRSSDANRIRRNTGKVGMFDEDICRCAPARVDVHAVNQIPSDVATIDPNVCSAASHENTYVLRGARGHLRMNVKKRIVAGGPREAHAGGWSRDHDAALRVWERRWESAASASTICDTRLRRSRWPTAFRSRKCRRSWVTALPS